METLSFFIQSSYQNCYEIVPTFQRKSCGVLEGSWVVWGPFREPRRPRGRFLIDFGVHFGIHFGATVYKNRKELPRVLGGIGIAIISTSSGIMTDREARKRGIGGEVLCYVW